MRFRKRKTTAELAMVNKADKRPSNGQAIAYFFEPFSKWYVGTYDLGTDSVSGPYGFTSFEPEVLYWIPCNWEGRRAKS